MSTDLLAKYNVPTPRYTSYPPANYFHEQFGAEDFREAVMPLTKKTPGIFRFMYTSLFVRVCVITADATRMPWKNAAWWMHTWRH